MDSKPPSGWEWWDPAAGDKNRPVSCDDCGWEGREDEAEGYIPDLSERLDPGMIVPVGCCPATVTDTGSTAPFPCGALVYYSDVEIVYRKKPNVLEKIVEATSLHPQPGRTHE